MNFAGRKGQSFSTPTLDLSNSILSYQGHWLDEYQAMHFFANVFCGGGPSFGGKCFAPLFDTFARSAMRWELRGFQNGLLEILHLHWSSLRAPLIAFLPAESWSMFPKCPLPKPRLYPFPSWSPNGQCSVGVMPIARNPNHSAIDHVVFCHSRAQNHKNVPHRPVCGSMSPSTAHTTMFLKVLVPDSFEAFWKPRWAILSSRTECMSVACVGT